MIDFKNVLKVPYLNYNYFLIILILSLITVISDVASGISIFLTLFLSVGLIGTNFSFNLKEYSSKNIFKILEYSLIYFISSFIFFIFQGIFAIIFAIPIIFLRGSIDVDNLLTFNSTMFLFIILLIIIIFGILILELIKNIGFIKYTRNKKFEDFFDFKSNLKIIFTKNFLIGFLFLIGYLLLIFLILFILLLFLNLLFPSYAYYFTGIFIVFLIFFFVASSFLTFNEIYKAYK